MTCKLDPVDRICLTMLCRLDRSAGLVVGLELKTWQTGQQGALLGWRHFYIKRDQFLASLGRDGPAKFGGPHVAAH